MTKTQDWLTALAIVGFFGYLYWQEKKKADNVRAYVELMKETGQGAPTPTKRLQAKPTDTEQLEADFIEYLIS